MWKSAPMSKYKPKIGMKQYRNYLEEIFPFSHVLVEPVERSTKLYFLLRFLEQYGHMIKSAGFLPMFLVSNDVNNFLSARDRDI